MDSVNIKPNKKTSPKDGQKVLFQVVVAELYGKWCKGIFIVDNDFKFSNELKKSEELEWL